MRRCKIPSSVNYKRNYSEERKSAIARGETSNGKESGDNKRHKARRAKEKQLGRKLPSDVHVDHKKPLKSGGSNDTSNLRLKGALSNSSHGGEIGDKKGKAKGGRKGKRGALSS